jgi:hypothetical protein
VVYVKNVGDGTVVIINLYVNGALVTIDSPETPYNLSDDQIVGFSISELENLTSGTKRKIRVVCEDGTFSYGTYTVP